MQPLHHHAPSHPPSSPSLDAYRQTTPFAQPHRQQSPQSPAIPRPSYSYTPDQTARRASGVPSPVQSDPGPDSGAPPPTDALQPTSGLLRSPAQKSPPDRHQNPNPSSYKSLHTRESHHRPRAPDDTPQKPLAKPRDCEAPQPTTQPWLHPELLPLSSTAYPPLQHPPLALQTVQTTSTPFLRAHRPDRIAIRVRAQLPNAR